MYGEVPCPARPPAAIGFLRLLPAQAHPRGSLSPALHSLTRDALSAPSPPVLQRRGRARISDGKREIIHFKYHSNHLPSAGL